MEIIPIPANGLKEGDLFLMSVQEGEFILKVKYIGFTELTVDVSYHAFTTLQNTKLSCKAFMTLFNYDTVWKIIPSEK